MDVISLRGILGLDKSEYDRGLKEADSQVSSFGSKFKSTMGKAAKAGAAAMGAAATAVGVLGKSSIQAYADTEQLVGGVQKLYGNMGMSVQDYAKTVNKSVSEVRADWERNEEAQNIVLNNAKNAFKTAGLSYNEYMEQATSFSAALINSLGGDTVKAAEQTDVAMRAIADNYNTFGGDMSMIQYAFQGFAKQNYTMLDNLKLGYGGTKTEMERLIADANKWAEENGKAADLSIDSFSDVVTAIDYIQQKQNIAGTTSREAASTISGSIGMVKAAYSNLIGGLANPDADISQLTSDLVSSITTAGKNLLPAVGQFAKGFGEALSELTPTIVQGVPKILSSALPILISSAMDLISTLGKTLLVAAPQLVDVGKNLLKSLTDGVKANASDFIESGMNVLLHFSEFIRDSAGDLIPLGLKLIKSLADGIINNIPTFIQTVPTIMSNFAGVVNDNMPKVIATGVSILASLVKGIIKSIPTLIANLPKIFMAFIDVWMAFNWMSLGKHVITAIGKGLKAAGGAMKSAIKDPINAVKSAINGGFKAAKDKAVGYMNSLKKGVTDKIQAAKDTVKKVVDKIKGFFPLKIGKIFSNLKLPHFSVKGKAPFGLGGMGEKPKISVNWNKKAYDVPYLFNRPTVISGMGFGDGVGDEMVYGKSSLMGDIKEAMKEGGASTTNYFTVTVNGAESPEEWADKFTRQLKLNMRTA